MTLFVETSVWSGAFRRDQVSSADEVSKLAHALQSGETLFTTGIVLRDLLQGFSGLEDRVRIEKLFSAVPLLVPDREDHVRAAQLPNIVAEMAFRSAPSMQFWRVCASAMI